MRRSLLPLALALLLVPPSSPPAAAAIDRFYRERMEAGNRAFERGDWQEAADELRIACFGHLEEPLMLAEGLIRLGTAQAALNDRGGFLDTFSRISELEERFSAYSEAGVGADLREAFENQAVRLVPPQTLRSAAGFGELARRSERQRLAGLPPDERRAELEDRMRREPENGEWPLEMARLELEERHPRRALDWLDRLPPDVAAATRASCLRQQAASERKDCERMDLMQPFCAEVPASVMEFRLTCLVAARRWPEAAALLETLPPESLAKRRITRLAETVRSQGLRPEPAAPGGATAAAAEPLPEPPAPGGVTAAAAEPPPEPPAETDQPAAPPVVPMPKDDPARLAALSQRLARAETEDDLEALLADAGQLADARPGSRGAQLLAAEIAYLLSDWSQAVAYYRKAGDTGADEVRPSFYYAVALYETGERAAAATVLRPVVEQLEQTPFVRSYVNRILASGSGAAPPGI